MPDAPRSNSSGSVDRSLTVVVDPAPYPHLDLVSDDVLEEIGR
jgi:hypothetical protein